MIRSVMPAAAVGALIWAIIKTFVLTYSPPDFAWGSFSGVMTTWLILYVFEDRHA